MFTWQHLARPWASLSPAAPQRIVRRGGETVTVPIAAMSAFAVTGWRHSARSRCAGRVPMAETLTIAMPMAPQRMRHGHQRLRPSAAEESASRVIALARAYPWQQRLLSGADTRVHQLAASLGCAPADVARTLQLARRAPDRVEAILHGRLPGLTLQARPQTFPVAWSAPRALRSRGRRNRSHAG